MRLLLVMLAALVSLVALVPVLLVAFPFLLVATLTRLVAKAFEPAYLFRDQLIVFDPHFGWRAKPNLDTHHLSVDLFHIRTDGDGWRGKFTIEESAIVVIGDSFAAGYGVGERHFFGNVSRQPKIKPIGIGGYSMVQEYLWMCELGERLRGKLVVWFIYFGNDLYDNLCPDVGGIRKPFLRESATGGPWEIHDAHVRSEQWPIVTKVRLEGAHQLARLADLCCPTYLARRAYSACSHLLQAGRDLCARVGADMVVMTVPDPWQLSPQGHERLLALGGTREKFNPDYPDQQVEAICRRLGIGFLAGKSFLDVSCYKSNDCHWNERGHRKVARALAALLPSPRTRALPSQPSHALSTTVAAP
jgi:hypothetical protein